MLRPALLVLVVASVTLAAAPKFPGIKALEKIIPSKVKGFDKKGPDAAKVGATETHAVFRATDDGTRVEVSVKWDDGSTDELDALTNHDGCVDEKIGARTVRACSKPLGLYRYTFDWQRNGLEVVVGVDVKSNVTEERARAAATAIATQMLK